MEETPFNLAFGTEIVMPVELEVPSAWVINFDEETNSERWLTYLDLLDEAYERAYVRLVAYQQKVAHYFNSKV